jgi:hypothetical protein
MMPTITETIVVEMEKVRMVANTAISKMLSIVAAKIQLVMISPIPSVEAPLMVIWESRAKIMIMTLTGKI